MDAVDTNTSMEEMNKMFNKTKTELVATYTTFEKTFGENIKTIDTLLPTITSKLATSTVYDGHRSQVFSGLTVFILVIVLLQTLGLGLGVFFYKKYVYPHERSFLSNLGGIFLMSSTGFIFIVFSLLMLLTTASFLIGGVGEIFLCHPLTDDNDYKVATELLDKSPNAVGETGSFLGRYIHNDSDVDLPIANVLKECANNGPAYTVLKMDSKFPLENITGSKDGIGKAVDESTNKLAKPIPMIAGMSDTHKQKLAELNKNKTERATYFGNRIKESFASYIAKVELSMKTIGGCQPLYNSWTAIINKQICGYLIDPVHGFWFSLGWTVLSLIPSIVFNIRTAKYLRRMVLTENDEEDANRKSSTPSDDRAKLSAARLSSAKSLQAAQINAANGTPTEMVALTDVPLAVHGTQKQTIALAEFPVAVDLTDAPKKESVMARIRKKLAGTSKKQVISTVVPKTVNVISEDNTFSNIIEPASGPSTEKIVLRDTPDATNKTSNENTSLRENRVAVNEGLNNEISIAENTASSAIPKSEITLIGNPVQL